MARPMKRIGRWLAASAGAALLLAAGAVLLDRLFPPDLSRLANLSVLVEDKDGGLLRAFTAKDGGWRLPVTVDEVDPRYRRMLLAYEDKRFESHWGVDPLALLRAMGQFVTAGPCGLGCLDPHHADSAPAGAAAADSGRQADRDGARLPARGALRQGSASSRCI